MLSNTIYRLLSFFLLPLLLLCLSVSALQAQQPATIKGKVLDSNEDTPLMGVTVTLTGENKQQGTTTTAAGTFQLKDIPYGSYTIEVSYVGYQLRQRKVRINEPVIDLVITLEKKRYGLDEVVISATRELESREDIPASVTSISNEELNRQSVVTGDLGTILAQQTPGLAPSTQSLSNYGQTLRGRNISVLIDGIPQSTPLRNVLRDLKSIDPQAIERVEIIRGSSAAYGYGAPGGIVNIITSRGTTEELDLKTEVGSRFNTEHLSGSFSHYINQGIGVRNGNFDFNLHGGYERIGSFFDADGDRIPIDPHGQGGLAHSDEFTLSANFGYTLNDNQQLRVTGNYYSIGQDVEFVTDPGIPGEQKATAVPVNDAPGESPGTDNLSLGLEFIDNDLLSGRFSSKVYYQDYRTTFGYAGYFPGGGGQSYLASEKLGARVNMKIPIASLPGSYVQGGVDLLRDETAQPLTDGREWVPPIRQASLAPFAQVKIQAYESLIIRGGLRYENIGLKVDDFTTLFGNNPVEGGRLNYDALVGNAGLVYFITDRINTFASFSQAFSVADIGRELRGTSATSVEQLNPEAQKVNSYEAGIRASGESWGASLSGYINTSDLGTTFSGGNDFSIIRSPELVRGLEATLDVQLHKQLDAGGTWSIIEGRRDSDGNGSYDTYLTGDRIPPTKISAFLTYQPVKNLTTRLDLIYSGSRNRFPGSTGFAQGEVENYTLVDFTTSYPVGPGTLSLGIENVFNRQYFPAISQWYNLGFGYSAGRGRMVSLAYKLDI